jgi:hypothetical protein
MVFHWQEMEQTMQGVLLPEAKVLLNEISTFSS